MSKVAKQHKSKHELLIEALTLNEKFDKPSQLTNYATIKCKELTNYYKQIHHTLSEEILTFHLKLCELTENLTEHELAEERKKLQETSLSLVFELTRRKINLLLNKVKDQHNKRRQEIEGRNMTFKGEEPLEKYVKQLKEDAAKLEIRIIQESGRIEALSNFIEKEHGIRNETVAKYANEIEKIKKEYDMLQKEFEDKEVELLKTRADKAGLEQFKIDYLLKCKEVDQLKEEHNALEHKLKTQLISTKSNHLRVFLFYFFK